MWKTIIAICLLILLITNTSDCFGQDETLIIGPVTLRLGMFESEATSKLQKYYDLKKTEREEYWDIINKQGPPYNRIGAVQFIDNKLVGAVKDWGSFHGDDVCKLGKSLFSLLANMNEEGKKLAAVTTFVHRGPTATSMHIWINFGKKQIGILVWENEEIGNGVTIQEEMIRLTH